MKELKEMRHWYDVLWGVFCVCLYTNSVLLLVVFVISQKKLTGKLISLDKEIASNKHLHFDCTISNFGKF